MPLLTELASAAGFGLHGIPADIHITQITADSRQVKPGALFAALPGGKSDGTTFIAQAQQAGATAVLLGKNANIPSPIGGRLGGGYDRQLPTRPYPNGEGNIIILRSSNPHLALAYMAAAFYGAQLQHMAAVTGTDGKTSTADFFRQFWHLLGASSASIGTLGILSGNGATLFPGTHTTPDPVQLHAQLAELASKHIEHACLEASSHGLDQFRLDGVMLEAAAFTNIARDHLDYHHTEEAYFAAKSQLFARVLPPGKTAVLNEDDAKFPQLKALCEERRQRIIGFGKSGSQFRLRALTPHVRGQRAELELFGKPHQLDVPLVGAFQVMNILAALGLVVGTGGELEQALAVIPQLHGVPGRLERVAQLPNGACIFIDYAHTPMALANILTTLRPHTAGKLHVVFGCGGDRDAGKRPQMGRVAAELADFVTVTDDNPRSEAPAAIRSAILAACAGAKEVADRAQAIYVAIRALAAGDNLVIAGKGHETVQIIGDQSLPFSDADVAREAAAQL